VANVIAMVEVIDELGANVGCSETPSHTFYGSARDTTARMGVFRKWKDHDAYHQAFERMLRDLKADVRP
jgi:hypothetical protein